LGIAAVRELAAMQTIRITNVPVLFTCSTELRQPLLGAVCQTMIKRMLLVLKWILLSPLCVAMFAVLAVSGVAIEIPFYFFRWLIMGKSFPTAPLLMAVLMGEWKEYFSGDY
jgi:Na+/glutamate symporter